MESLQGFIEIGQDAAAVIEVGGTAKGVYTGSIQTCMVMAFECRNALIVVHDSAQLAFSDISTLIEKHGRCHRFTAIYPAHDPDYHQDRIKRCKLITGVSAKAFRKEAVAMDAFAVMFATSGDYHVIPNGIAKGFEPLSDKAVRTSITELNNFFIVPNSRSLRLDVQYFGGAYQDVRRPDRSVVQMITRMEEQPRFFFNNVALLYAAHQLGVFILPDDLVQIVETHNLQRYRSQIVQQSEQHNQLLVFSTWLNQRKLHAI